MNDEPEKAEEAPHDYETEAATFGWKSADDFGGDSGNHMSAEAFMVKGPGTSRKAEARIAELEKGRSEFEEEMRAGYADRLSRMERTVTENAELNATARAKDAAVARREKAEGNGLDMDTYDILEKDRPKDSPAKAPVDDVPREDQIIIEGWIAKNEWFKTDPIANADAITYYRAFAANGSNTQEALDKATERMKLKAPYLFPAPEPKKSVASVDGGGLGRRSGGKKTWADVPAEEKRDAQVHIDDGFWDLRAKEYNVSPKEAFAIRYWRQE